MSCIRRIRVNAAPVLINIFSVLIIPSITLTIINNYSGPYKYVYAQQNQMNANITNLLNIESVPSKKVHVG